MIKQYNRSKTTKRKTNEEFIAQAQAVHGNKYGYSKVDYVNQNTNICIICPIHGEFWQKPKVHLMGRGCQECGKDVCRGQRKRTKKDKKHVYWTTVTFIDECKKIYGNKYTYENTEYNGMKNKIRVNCPKHGEFLTNANKFIHGRCGCPKCWNEKKHDLYSSTTEEFIRKAKKKNGEKMYDYSKTEYRNNSTKVCIICPEHGEFWMTPANHLKHEGCPVCKSEKLVYEHKLYHILMDIVNVSDIVRQYQNYRIFGRQSLDFYIPKYKIAIEHQGSQHFGAHYFDYDNNKIKRIKELDKRKYELCKENGIKLFYFTYEKYYAPREYFDTVYTDIEELKKNIIDFINNSIKNKTND